MNSTVTHVSEHLLPISPVYTSSQERGGKNEKSTIYKPSICIPENLLPFSPVQAQEGETNTGLFVNLLNSPEGKKRSARGSAPGKGCSKAIIRLIKSAKRIKNFR